MRHSQIAIIFKLLLRDASFKPFGINFPLNLKCIDSHFLYQNLVNFGQTYFILG